MLLNEACSTRADYFARLGSLLLQQQRPEDAAVALEKALLLQPDLPGVELDYAQALATLGEKNAAKSLAQTVMERPDIPAPLHEWLSTALGQKTPGWQWSGYVQSLMGAETNLNSAPASQTLVLTLPGGNVPINLAEAERVQAGVANLNTVSIQGVRAVGEGQLSVSGETSFRESPAHPADNLLWSNMGVTWGYPALGGDMGLQVVRNALWMGGQDLYQETTEHLFVEYGQPCRAETGALLSQRHYPAATLLDGVYRGGEMGFGCAQGAYQANVLGQWGQDQANNAERLGGNQGRQDLVAMGTHQTAGGEWTVVTQWSRLHDDQNYSSLLGGQTREIQRRALRLQYQHFLSSAWSLVGYWEESQQNSNIQLFELANRALYMGLRWSGNSVKSTQDLK